MQLSCKHCSTTFEADRSSRKFCGSSCAAKANNPKRARAPKTCTFCKGPLGTGRKYCTIHCQQADRYVQYIERWLVGLETGNKGTHGTEVSSYVRRWLFERADNSCEECGWDRKNPTTGKIPLTIDHVDGDWNKTRPENLKLLCPNCHSLTPTYGSLNTGRGRRSVIEGP